MHDLRGEQKIVYTLQKSQSLFLLLIAIHNVTHPQLGWPLLQTQTCILVHNSGVSLSVEDEGLTPTLPLEIQLFLQDHQSCRLMSVHRSTCAMNADIYYGINRFTFPDRCCLSILVETYLLVYIQGRAALASFPGRVGTRLELHE